MRPVLGRPVLGRPGVVRHGCGGGLRSRCLERGATARAGPELMTGTSGAGRGDQHGCRHGDHRERQQGQQ